MKSPKSYLVSNKYRFTTDALGIWINFPNILVKMFAKFFFSNSDDSTFAQIILSSFESQKIWSFNTKIKLFSLTIFWKSRFRYSPLFNVSSQAITHYFSHSVLSRPPRPSHLNFPHLRPMAVTEKPRWPNANSLIFSSISPFSLLSSSVRREERRLSSTEHPHLPVCLFACFL